MRAGSKRKRARSRPGSPMRRAASELRSNQTMWRVDFKPASSARASSSSCLPPRRNVSRDARLFRACHPGEVERCLLEVEASDGTHERNVLRNAEFGPDELICAVWELVQLDRGRHHEDVRGWGHPHRHRLSRNLRRTHESPGGRAARERCRSCGVDGSGSHARRSRGSYGRSEVCGKATRRAGRGSRLRRVRVHDREALAPDEADELRQHNDVVPRCNLLAEMT
jgi:hypothetical protein